MLNRLNAVGPLDGRYAVVAGPLAEIFSEKGLMKYRVKVEAEYLLALSDSPGADVRKFSAEEKKTLCRLWELSDSDAGMIKDIEERGCGGIGPTNHDLKALEYFIKEKLKQTTLKDCLEWVHFALTSEDVNNCACSLMLCDGLERVIVPALREIHGGLEGFAGKYGNLAMLARTHGQPASPTTLGKEFKVFSSRLKKQLEQLEKIKLPVKLNGATGNYNAHVAAYPKADWLKFTRDFAERFNAGRKIKVCPNFVTTQIEPHDGYAELFDALKRVNSILIGFDQDIWRYISDGWIKQKIVKSEVGSSTMPHKVNPINFENSEGNLGLANALLEFFSRKLPVSRLQRDLSDSTVMRNFGVALGHCLVGYKYLSRGLDKIEADESVISRELESHPEVTAEAIQTILRREGVSMPYEALKQLTRGRRVTAADMEKFIDGLAVKPSVKAELKKLRPGNYTGLANVIVKEF